MVQPFQFVADARDQLLLVVASVVDARVSIQRLLAETKRVLDLLVLGLGDYGRVQQQDVVDLQQSRPHLHEVVLAQVDLQDLLQVLELIFLEDLAFFVEVYDGGKSTDVGQQHVV